MPRVLMSTEGWGVLLDRFGNARAGLDASFTTIALAAATHWSAETGGTSSTAPVTADTRGRLMRWIEAGEYLMTVEGETNAVNAVVNAAAVVESPLAEWARLTRPAVALATTFPRGLATSTAATLVSGKLRMVPIFIPASTLITSITFTSRNIAAVTPTNQWFALYDKTRVLLRQTVNDTTAAWAINTPKTLALTSTYTTLTSDLYLLGCMVAAATTNNLAGNDSIVTLHEFAPVYNGATSESGLTATAPNPAGAIAAGGGTPYAFVS